MTLDIGLPDSAWEGVDASTEALLDRWLVAEGARVAAGVAVARVILVKSQIDVGAPADGLIERILVPAGATFARGQPIGRMAP